MIIHVQPITEPEKIYGKVVLLFLVPFAIKMNLSHVNKGKPILVSGTF